MGGVLAIVCIAVTVLIAAILIWDVVARRHDALSWKHLFLIGFVVFFGTGGFFTVVSNVGSELWVASDRAMAILAGGIVLFLAVFFGFLRVGLRARWVDKVVPRLDLPRTTPAVLICNVAALLLVVASLAFPASGDSFTSALGSYFRGGMAVTATGLATYWLLTQKYNPLSWALMAGTVFVALVASIFGESGRRQLLGVLMVIPWVWYYTTLRYQPTRAWVPKVGVLLAAGFLLLVGYSGVRASLRGSERTISALSGALVQSAASANVSGDNLRRDLFYQDAATNSMFIIDSYPETYAQQPLRGLVWFVTNPIPRSMWPAKPNSLGGEISEAQTRIVGNIAPGIIGHGWAEVGWFGIMYYAAFFGFVIGAGDRLLQIRSHNPFFVTAMGSALGQVIAMSRGDVPLFFLQATLSTLTAFGLMYGCKLAFGTLMAAFPRLRTGFDPEEAPADLGEGDSPEAHDPGETAWDGGDWQEQDWGQASAAWEYSEHEAERGQG